MIYPIFIPSKKRPDGKTFSHLEGIAAKKTLFLEREDAIAYKKHEALFDEIVLLDESNQGIVYVRNAMKKHAERNKLEWFWSMDDDIDSFHQAETGKKMRKVEASEALRGAQDIITKLNAALGAINYGQFAFNKTKPYSLNKKCLICTLNNVEKLRGLSYDKKAALKEDLDFTLQILNKKHRTVLCEQIAFKVPVYGTNKGGLHDFYKIPGVEKDVSLYLEEKWGKHMVRAYVKETGRWDIRINWKLFK
jgi:hypothetical protein